MFFPVTTLLLVALVPSLILSSAPPKSIDQPTHRKFKARSILDSQRRVPSSLTAINLNNVNLTQPDILAINKGLNRTREEDRRLLCNTRTLNSSLWWEMDMNAYLSNYPNGTVLSLEEYALQVGAIDFQCGIGKVCNPGQLCESVYGQDWYALVAAQNWNNFMNVLYQASGDAFDIASDKLPMMLIDLEEDPSRACRHFTAWVGLFSNWISSFPSSLFKSYGRIVGTIWSWGTISWLVIVMASYQATAFGWLQTLVIQGNGEDRFTRSSSITWMLGQAQHVVQGIISNITQEVLTSGISSDKGLAGVNRDGIFISGEPLIDREMLQKEYEEILKVKMLVKIWRVQNAFIVRGADPCTQNGQDGAFDDPNRLSYCGKDSIMMSIVRGEINGDGFDPTIYHAALVEQKYDITTEYLVTTSWECQKTYRAFDFEPYLASNENMGHVRDLPMANDCIVNLPVCDCTTPDMIQALKNGTSITKACRVINGLPI